MSEFLLNKDVQLEDLGNGVSRKILAYSDNIMPVEVYFEKGAVGAAHTHSHEQVTYVLEGEFEFTCDGKTQRVKTGDSIYFAPDAVHGTVCIEKGKLLDVFTPYREDFVK